MKKKKFKITYVDNLKLLKESLHVPQLPKMKKINACWMLIIILLGIQALITGESENFVKVSDLFLIWAFFPYIVSVLNKNDGLKEMKNQAKKTYDVIEVIDENELHKNYPTLNVEESFPLDSFQRIVKSKNIYYIHFEDDKRRGWTTIYRHNIEGGSEEELIDFLFLKCKNIKKKKIINTRFEKMFCIFRLIILIIDIVIFAGSIIDMFKFMFQI